MKLDNSFLNAFAEGLRPIPDLTVDEWCDLFGKLPPSVSEPGRFRVDRIPYMREILRNMTPNNGINKIIMMFGAQLAKTEVLNQFQAYLMHYNPTSYIFYQPTVELVESYVKNKINPMIDSNEVLSPIFKNSKTNNLTEKTYKGCVGTYKGANSGSGFRMLSVPVVLGDEIDAWPRDVEGEGSPIKLAGNRTTSFGAKAKEIYPSTPTEKDNSNVEDEFLKGDQRYYFVPCPCCKSMQRLVMSNLKYTKNPNNELKAEDVYYQCEYCPEKITEDKKTWMLANGEWKAMNPDAPSNVRSYQLSGLYSPLGWLSWGKICDEWLFAQKDREALRAFINTRLGETFFEASSQPSYAQLKERKDDNIKQYEVDERVVKLYAGIDTQDNRFAILVLGFGKDQEQFVVAYEEILGSPANKETWDQLKTFVDRPFKHRSGNEIFISSAAIDTGGHHTSAVYNFVRQNQNKYYAIKGASNSMGNFMKEGSDIDFDHQTGQKFTNSLKLWLVNTILAKKTIYSFINNMLDKKNLEGAGVIHFSGSLPDAFFPMLVSERLIRKQVNGAIKEEFILQKGIRNEALDCYVYAYSVAYAIGRVNNIYGANYDLLLKQLTNKDAPKQPAMQKPNNSSWLGKSKSGFSIKSR